MNTFAPRRLATGAAFGVALGAWYVAGSFAAEDQFAIGPLGFRTTDPLLATAIGAGGGILLGLIVVLLEHVLRIDREGVVPEAAGWTGRALSAQRARLGRSIGVLFLLAAVPFVGLFVTFVVCFFALPLMALHRRGLEGEPEHYELDAGGLGCMTLFLVALLTAFGGWLEQAFEWGWNRIDAPQVVEWGVGALWSVGGTVGTLLLAMAIIERAELPDIDVLLKRFWRWQVLGIAISLTVRVAAFLVLTALPIGTIAMMLFRWAEPNFQDVDMLVAFGVVSMICAVFLPPVVAFYTLLVGRTLVQLFPERLRPEPQMIQPAPVTT